MFSSLINQLRTIDCRIQLLTVFVVGHTDCGGVIAGVDAARRPDGGIINGRVVTVPDLPAGADAALNRWLEPVTQTAIFLRPNTPNYDTAISAVTQENVRRQCEFLSNTGAIMRAWQARQQVTLHGRIFDIASGVFQEWTWRRDPPPP